MRVVGRASVALVALLTACAVARTEPPPETPKSLPGPVAAQETVARTVALVSPSGRLYCSGVWVSHTHALTAHHCVDDTVVGETIWYAVESDLAKDKVERRRGFVAAYDAQHDLALLIAELPAPAHPEAALYRGAIERGQKVAAMGHPTGLWWSYSEGEVAAVREAHLPSSLMDPVGTVFWIQTTVPIAGGSSGGGLWDLQTGRLLGIASRGRAEVINFFVHRDYLDRFLAENGLYR